VVDVATPTAAPCAGRNFATVAIPDAMIQRASDAIHAPDVASCMLIRGSITLPTASIPVIPVGTLTARPVVSAGRPSPDSKHCGVTAVDVIRDRSRRRTEVSRHGVRPDVRDATVARSNRHAVAKGHAVAAAFSNPDVDWNRHADAKGHAAAVKVSSRAVTPPEQVNT
jgi:hypothetical protein